MLEKPVSDRGRLGDVSQSPQLSFKRYCKSLILNGEMLERSIRHAWKAMWRVAPSDTETPLVTIDSTTSTYKMFFGVTP